VYKGIRSDWTDKYSGKIDNSIGKTIKFPRNKVDDNRENQCSWGLHVGSLDYVVDYCTERVVLVKVNPRDVVSVPKDHDAQKCRVCEYTVLSEYDGELVRSKSSIEEPLRESNGGMYSTNDDEEEDYLWDT